MKASCTTKHPLLAQETVTCHHAAEGCVTTQEKVPLFLRLEAKRAMKQALRMAVEYEDSDQRHAISEALSHLENIQRS